ncbi:hypothetical protein GLYMA_20G072166v4 [Glycine max]|nr:hypothetical protein GLYMA_20G072166v4 [Glycine max]KAH1034973.1 hypothetical protein GYH30_055101 [Glycine max]
MFFLASKFDLLLDILSSLAPLNFSDPICSLSPLITIFFSKFNANLPSDLLVLC